MNSFSSQLLMLYFDHCARRDYNDSAAARQAVSTGGGKHATRPLFPSTGGGAMQTPGYILSSTEQVLTAPVAAPVLPVASSTSAFAASRTTGSSSRRRRSSHRRRRHRHSSSSDNSRTGRATSRSSSSRSRSPRDARADWHVSPGGNLMSIWGKDKKELGLR